MEKTQVISIIADQLGIAEGEITEETAFADLGADSLDLFQIISALEEKGIQEGDIVKIYDLEFDYYK